MGLFRHFVQRVAVSLPVLLWLTTLSAQTLITTVAGKARSILGASGVPATSFPLDDPCAVAADNNGNVYFTDIGYNMVFRISNGTVYPFAGTGAPQSGPAGGKALQTAIESPWAIATDAGGNVYFTEFEGLTRVLRVDTTGAITTVAGGGRNVLQFSSFLFGDGGPASRADFFEPYGVAVDPSGNVFVSNQSGNRISKVSPDGIIGSLIGILQSPGFSGDGGPAQLALMNLPQGLATDKQGNLYFADRNNNRIRKIATNGVITTVAGNGQTGFSGDQGLATAASLTLPAAVAVDSSGNLFIADRYANVVRRVDGNGIITTIAGNGANGFNGDEGNALTLSLYQPNSVAVDNNGNVYVVDTKNRRIRMITPGGVMKTIAGNGQSFFSGDGGPAISADLDHPSSAKFDSSGSMYVADSDNQRVRKITTDGMISTIAGNGTAGYSGDNGQALDAELNGPADVAVDSSGRVYIADTVNNCIRLVGANHIISTFAGNGRLGYSGDGGPATMAELDQPTGIVLAPNGDLIIADRNNNRVRRVDSNGIITTIAGNGVQSYGGDGGPAAAASIDWPAAVAFNANGELLIAATQERRVRKVDTQGIISTIAGTGSGDWPPQQDFIPATQVDLDTPTAVAADQEGNVFTNGTNQIQRINPGGILTIIVNQQAESAWGSSGDGGPGVLASLTGDNLGATSITHHLAIGPDGGLYIADANRIRRLANPSTPAQIGLSTVVVYPDADFSGDFSGPAPVTINNLGAGAMNWTATAQTLSGGNWLSVTPGSGGAGDTVNVQGVEGIFNTLPTGFYPGNVYINAPDASNSFVSVQVTANVGAPAVNTVQAVGGSSQSLVAGSLAVMTGQFVQTPGQNMVAENQASWQLGGVSVVVNGVYAPVISLANVDGTQQVVFEVPVEAGIGQTTAQVVALNGTAGWGLSNVPLTVMQPGGAPPASIIATAGSNQSTTVGTAFPVSLQAAVMDFAGNPAPDVTVTFSASSSGANGAFAGSALTATAVTNNAGVATAPAFSANGTPGGPFGVIATVPGAAAPAVFSLTNASPDCDIGNYGTVNVADVQLMIDEVLGVVPAVNDLNHDRVVNVVDVQSVITAALGLGCLGA